MKKILLITDHKWRDLAGYVYLKLLLEKNKDIRVRLCRLGEDRFWVLHDKPDLVIYNHLYEDRKVKFVKWLKKHGVGVIILPTENMPLRKGVEDLFAGKFTDLSPVDLYLSWNYIVADRIIELDRLPKDKVKIVGVPRFDFYCQPLTKLLPAKAQVQEKYDLNIDENAGIVLYSTNFTIASLCNKKNFLYKDWDLLKLNRVEGYKTQQIEGCMESDIFSRDLTIKSIEYLLNVFPQLQIIYKPHPSENHSFYKNIIKDLKKRYQGRFAFVTQEYIWNLLHISDLILQRTCTTAVEAWLFEKPTLELHMHSNEFYFSEEHASGSDIASSYEDIKKYVCHYLNGGKISDSKMNYRNNFLEKYCYKMDGKRTYEAAEIISNFLIGKEKTKYRISFKDFMRFYPKEYAKQLYRFCRNFIRKKFIGVDRLGRIDKQFSKQDVKFWKKQLSLILD